jgi:CubicO group peptidase (beta-lactamase class C family)
MRSLYFLSLLLFPLFSLAQSDYYYPPQSGGSWQMLSPDSLGWCPEQIDSLYAFLEAKNSKSFMVLHKGKRVLEKYFGSYTQDSIWYYASAGKSVMAFLIGQAQEEGLLDVQLPVSTYLGPGWTDCPPAKEDLITVWHQLTMTAGLDDGIPPTPQNPDPLNCLADTCLQYLSDAGTRWAYHNAPYRLVQDVLESASGQNKNQFTRSRLLQRVGMQGAWFNYVLFGRARDMARFGHLILSRGVWDGDSLLKDTAYFNAMVRPSQSLNPSYGYLWWLNGQSSHLLPRLQLPFSGPLIPNGPADMFAALGKNDQKIYVVPSQDLVVVRQGNDTGEPSLAISSFDNQLWQKINELACGATALAPSRSPDSFRLYPQPARDELWLTGVQTSAPLQVNLYSLQGQWLQGQQLLPEGKGYRLSTEGLRPGMYLLEVEGQGWKRLWIQ